jgi:hypothetical protein
MYVCFYELFILCLKDTPRAFDKLVPSTLNSKIWFQVGVKKSFKLKT